MVNWWVDYKLIETANLYSRIPVSDRERKLRAMRAVVARGYSDGSTILLVDFKGAYMPKALSAPTDKPP